MNNVINYKSWDLTLTAVYRHRNRHSLSYKIELNKFTAFQAFTKIFQGGVSPSLTGSTGLSVSTRLKEKSVTAAKANKSCMVMTILWDSWELVG